MTVSPLRACSTLTIVLSVVKVDDLKATVGNSFFKQSNHFSKFSLGTKSGKKEHSPFTLVNAKYHCMGKM